MTTIPTYYCIKYNEYTYLFKENNILNRNLKYEFNVLYIIILHIYIVYHYNKSLL